MKKYDLKESKVVDFDNFTGKLNSFAIFLNDNKNLSFIEKNGFDKQRWMNAIDSLKNESIELIDSIIDSTITADGNGMILAVNKKACEMFGYDREELIGKDIKLIMGNHVSKNHDMYLNDYKKTGKEQNKNMLNILFFLN